MTLLAPAAPLPHEGRDIDALTLASLIYLSVPTLIFLVGWFKWPYAIVLALAVLQLIRIQFQRRNASLKLPLTPTTIVVICATALAWSAFGGGSHFMYANHDWVVRDAVFGDLAREEWPVLYQAKDGSSMILRSAIGYFLPAALVAKLGDSTVLSGSIYVWTAIGVTLFMLLLPLPPYPGLRLAIALLVTVFFSGMDFLGVVLSTQSMPIFPLRLEWWVPLSYQSLTGQLLWAPNHCLPLWLGTLLILRHAGSRDLLTISSALLPVTLIWTPFAVLGLAPFLLLGLSQTFRRHGLHARDTAPVVLGLLVGLPVAAFLLIDVASISSGSGAIAHATASDAHKSVSFVAYATFVCCEFLLLAIALVPLSDWRDKNFLLAIVILLALPAVNFGPSNDLLLRVSTPPLIILLVATLNALSRGPLASLPRLLLLAILLIGSHTAVNELWRAASFTAWMPNYQKSLANVSQGDVPAHYAGRTGSSSVERMLRLQP